MRGGRGSKSVERSKGKYLKDRAAGSLYGGCTGAEWLSEGTLSRKAESPGQIPGNGQVRMRATCEKSSKGTLGTYTDTSM